MARVKRKTGGIVRRVDGREVSRRETFETVEVTDRRPRRRGVEGRGKTAPDSAVSGVMPRRIEHGRKRAVKATAGRTAQQGRPTGAAGDCVNPVTGFNFSEQARQDRRAKQKADRNARKMRARRGIK